MHTRCSHCQASNGVFRVFGRLTGVHLRCRGCGRTIRIVESVGGVFGVMLAFGVGYLIGFAALLELPVPAWIADAFGGLGLLGYHALVPTVPASLLATLCLGLLARRSGAPPPAEERLSTSMYTLTWVTAVLATLAVVALGVFAMSLAHAGERLPEPAVPAEPAVVARLEGGLAEWAFVTPEGERRDLASLDGRPVLLHVFDVEGPGVRPVLASIVRVGRKFADSGLVVVACAVGDEDALRRFAASPGAPRLPYVHAETPPPPRLVAVERPATTVIDRSGAILLRHGGAARWDTDEVESFLRRVVAR